MLKFKNAFSLAELLISLGILSIIATVGFTLTRQGIDRAYDMYLYTGYMGIYNAILDANANGLYISNNGQGNDPFFRQVASSLNTEFINNPNSTTITAPNGIEYIFRYHRSANIGGDLKAHYGITMNVPAKRTRIGVNIVDNLSTCLAYLPQNNFGILMPAQPFACQDVSANSIDLRRRIDLLPFYIDTGLTGRSRPIAGFVPREYYSAAEAVCSTTNSDVVFLGEGKASNTLYGCNSAPADRQTQVVGVVKPAHPRKIR